LDPKMALAVVSANYQDEVVSRARAIGAAFLTKPLSEQALKDFLDSATSKFSAR
jgi:AmiR/NasT family two-component response regulator